MASAPSSSGSKRKGLKLKTLSLPDKLKVLDRVDAGASMRMVCEEFKLKTSTFYDIKKSRDKIRKHCLSLEDPSTISKKKKRLKPAKFTDLDDAVYKWYKQERASGVNIRGVEMQSAAARFAEHLNIPNFHASAGWLFNFRTRHCLVNRKVVGESASADQASVEPFRKRLEKIIEEAQLVLAQVYNADETGLFWKAPPANTQASRHEKHVAGRKMAKDRLSILVGANADGSHRLKPMIVGKAKKPRAMKNIMNNLPVIYRGNKTAWFTRDLFHTWFHSYFVPAVIKFQMDVLGIPRDNVKAILLLDNAPAHPNVAELVGHGGGIKVLFLPPNTTSLIQPMDQGVIEACKRCYRFKYQGECLVVLENESDLEVDTRGLVL